MALPVYCVMPDHLHALVEGATATADFRWFVNRFKQATGFEFQQASGIKLWQEGYYDHVLREDESMIGVAAYILHNPVRAGLCASVRDYPYVGSDRYTIAELIDAVQCEPCSAGRIRRP